MFAELFAKVNTFASHHQVLFAVIIAICIISASWSLEQILDTYVFPKKKLVGYILTIAIAIVILWVTKHFILHVM